MTEVGLDDDTDCLFFALLHSLIYYYIHNIKGMYECWWFIESAETETGLVWLAAHLVDLVELSADSGYSLTGIVDLLLHLEAASAAFGLGFGLVLALLCALLFGEVESETRLLLCQ